MAHPVRVLREAERELDIIIEWLVGRSPQGAARLLAAFERALQELAANPLLFSLAPENEYVSVEVRNIFFKTARGRRYRAIYVIVEEEVRILHVRAPGEAVLRTLRFLDN
jgi:plasmid stabilization system protein ParE